MFHLQTKQKQEWRPGCGSLVDEERKREITRQNKADGELVCWREREWRRISSMFSWFSMSIPKRRLFPKMFWLGFFRSEFVVDQIDELVQCNLLRYVVRVVLEIVHNFVVILECVNEEFFQCGDRIEFTRMFLRITNKQKQLVFLKFPRLFGDLTAFKFCMYAPMVWSLIDGKWATSL